MELYYSIEHSKRASTLWFLQFFTLKQYSIYILICESIASPEAKVCIVSQIQTVKNLPGYGPSWSAI